MNTKISLCVLIAFFTATFAEQPIDSTQFTKTDVYYDSKVSSQHDTTSPVIIENNIIDKNKEPDLILKSKGDTVFLLVDDLTKIMCNVKEKVHSSRLQGYGGAGGFSHRLMSMDMSPVADLVNQDSKVNSYSFPALHHRYEILPMSGGMGYGGIGNGIRIGGGGYNGYKIFRSEPFISTDTTGSLKQMTLKVELNFGGLMIEKAIVQNNWNFYSGGILAFGSIEVRSKTHDYKNSSAFIFNGAKSDEGESANAAFMGFEAHSGGTYTLVPWMHVGGDICGLFYLSANGFENSFGGNFLGFVPSIGIRIVFGNLG